MRRLAKYLMAALAATGVAVVLQVMFSPRRVRERRLMQAQGQSFGRDRYGLSNVLRSFSTASGNIVDHDARRKF